MSKKEIHKVHSKSEHSAKVNVKVAVNNKTKFHKKHYIPLIIGVVLLVFLIMLFIIRIGSYKVKVGDTVSVDYIGYFDDGKVFDTSLKAVAEENNLERKQFGPLKFKVGGGQVIVGFDKAVIGLATGDSKKFKVMPEEGYGERDEGLVLNGLKRNLYVYKFSNLTKEIFKDLFDKSPVVGDIIGAKDVPWKLKVSKVQMDYIFVENLLKVGDAISLPGTNWNSVVKEIESDVITIRQNPIVGKFVAFPTSKGMVMGNVIDVKDDTYSIDTNHPLAGKTLIFELTIKDIEKA